MAKFVIHTEEKKKRRKRVYAWVALLTGIAGVLYYIFFEDREGFARYIPLIIGVNCLWIGIDNFKSIRRPRFIEINEQHVEWLIQEMSSQKFLIEWNDIRRIKKENDDSVTIFQDSSFSKHIPLLEFPAEERDQIFHLFAQYAESRQIQLLNFSGSSSALA